MSRNHGGSCLSETGQGRNFSPPFISKLPIRNEADESSKSQASNGTPTMEHRGVEYRIIQGLKPGDWK
jgi:hypothetical protein